MKEHPSASKEYTMTAYSKGQASTERAQDKGRPHCINPVGVLALILMIYSAFETLSSLFKYLLQFLVASRLLVGLNKSANTENLPANGLYYSAASKNSRYRAVTFYFLLPNAKYCNLALASPV